MPLCPEDICETKDGTSGIRVGILPATIQNFALKTPSAKFCKPGGVQSCSVVVIDIRLLAVFLAFLR